jgi:hypothetical protein
LLLVQSKALDEAPHKLSRAVAKLAGITFWSLVFFYWFNKPQFLTEGKLAAMLIIPSLGVPNWSVIYINTAPQSGATTIRSTGRAPDDDRKHRLHYRQHQQKWYQYFTTIGRDLWLVEKTTRRFLALKQSNKAYKQNSWTSSLVIAIKAWMPWLKKSWR